MNELFKKTENIFLVFCLFWGILFLLIKPPFQSNDEPEHMYRMYGFTQGTLNFQELTIDGNKQVGLILPVSLTSVSRQESRIFFHPEKKTSLSETKTLLKIPLNSQIKKFKVFGVPVYTPVSYFPSFIILWIMKLFSVSPIIMMYILRFCTLLTYLTMIYFAIKITPVKKWLFFSAAVVPQAIYLGSAINTDAIVTGFAFLATAYTLYLAYDKSIEKITTKQKAIISLFLTLLTICKFPYITMCLLLFIIPKAKFVSQKSRLGFILSVFLLNTFITFFTLFSHMMLTKGISASPVSHTISQNPLSYSKFLLGNFIREVFYYIHGTFAHFGWGDTAVPDWIIWAYIILLMTCGFVNDKNEPEMKLSFSKKNILAIIFVLMTLITLFTCFFLLSRNNGQGIAINNDVLFQGRYWIPLIPIFFLLFNSCKTRINLKWFKIITINIFNFLLFVCTVIIFCRYYV